LAHCNVALTDASLDATAAQSQPFLCATDFVAVAVAFAVVAVTIAADCKSIW